MAICINKNLAEYQSLKAAVGTAVPETKLTAAIGVWQRQNGLHLFPIIEEVKGVLQAGGVNIINTGDKINTVNAIPFEYNLSDAPIKELNKKISTWLSKFGIQVDSTKVIYDQNGEEIDAIAKANILEKIIQIVEGKANKKTLPEEAAHFLLEMLENTKELDGLLTLATLSETYKEVVMQYSATYGNTEGAEQKLAKEAAAKLIANELLDLWENQDNIISENPYIKTRFGQLVDNIFTFLKNLFTRNHSPGISFSEEVSPFKKAALKILNNESHGLSTSNLKDGYFYELTEEDKQRREKNRQSLTSVQILKDKLGYIVVEGENRQRIKFRVSSLVKNYYLKLYGAEEKSDTADSRFAALKGTILHKWYEHIFKAIYNDTTPVFNTIREQVFQELQEELQEEMALFPDSYKDVSPRDVMAVSSKQFEHIIKGITEIYNEILKNQNKINQITNSNGKPELFFELTVVSKKRDVAGTIDLAVLYSNGKLAFYDYKNISFKHHRGEIIKPVPLHKINDFEMKMSQYKNILVEDYGITDVGESRIIPINVQYNEAARESKKGFTSIEFNTPDSPNREFLSAISVAKETLGLPEFDSTVFPLLYQRLANLENKFDKEKNRDIKHALGERIRRTRQHIQSLTVKRDFTYIYDEINTLGLEFEDKIHRLTGDEASLSMEFLVDLEDALRMFEEYVPILKRELAAELSPEQIEILNQVDAKLNNLKSSLNHVKKDLLLNTFDPERIDITKPGRLYKGLGIQFMQLSEFNHPVFQKLSTWVRRAENNTRRALKVHIKEIDVADNELKKWARTHNLSRLEAFNKIYNKETGRLYAKYDRKFEEDANLARKNQDVNFFLKYYQITYNKGTYQYTGKALESYQKAEKRQIEYIMREYPNDTFKQKSEIEKWKKSNNISYNQDVIFSKGSKYNFSFMFVDYEKLDRDTNQPAMNNYFSKEYSYIKANKELLNYYEMHINFNRLMEDITGRDLGPTFVANIRQDLADKIGTVGLGGLFTTFSSFIHSMEIRDENEYYQEKDKSQTNLSGREEYYVPFLLTDSLKDSLLESEKDAIIKEVNKNRLPGTTTEQHNNNVLSAIRAAMRKKGLETKSNDLTRSLLLMLNSAYMYKHMTEMENLAKMLLSEARSTRVSGEVLDTDSQQTLDRVSTMVKKRLGLEDDMVSAFEDFVNLYVYGKKTKRMFKSIHKGRRFDADGNITSPGVELAVEKAISNLIAWSSHATLGLKPILIARNFIQVKSNLLLLATEGKYFSTKEMKEAMVEARKNPELYWGASEFFQVHGHDFIYEKANDMSSRGLTKYMTADRLHAGLKLTDENIDRNTLVAMMMFYGLDSTDGRVKPVKFIKGEDKRSLYERSKIDDNKELVIEGLNNYNADRFRSMVQRVASKIKGTVPIGDRMLIGTTVLGQMLTQYKSWLPGLVKARFKGLHYDDLMQTSDMGRFLVAWQDIATATEGKFNSFVRLFISSIPIVGYVINQGNNSREGAFLKTNEARARVIYEEFIALTPQAKDMSFNEFVEMRMGKLRALALELQIVLGLALMMMLAKMLIPDDKDENPLETFATRNLYRIIHGAYLEASFFVSITSATEIFRTPMAISGFLDKMGRFISNTADETRDILSGKDYKGILFWEEDSQDKKGLFHYMVGLTPGANALADFFNVFDDFNYKKR